jgi:hypothetical protein
MLSNINLRSSRSAGKDDPRAVKGRRAAPDYHWQGTSKLGDFAPLVQGRHAHISSLIPPKEIPVFLGHMNPV